MEIDDTRNKTPNKYSISNIQVAYSWFRGYSEPYLVISVKPEGYHRDRFSEGGASYEVKKHGARTLRINFDEFQRMADALRDEVILCHQILAEHNLTSKLAEARNAQQSQETSAIR